MAFTGNQWKPTNKAEKDSVREQLDHLLAHPVFRSSVRCPKLLRYVVEYSLDGDGVPLKERILGIEVFGRDPGYDTDQDTIVRAAAGDIRKRIAQYYHEPGHESEIRIDLPAGSYLAEFHLPAETPVATPVPPVPEVQPPVPLPVVSSGLGRRKIVLGVSFVVLVALVTGWGWSRWVSRNSTSSDSATVDYTGGRGQTIDLFWKPIFEQTGPLLLCVGEPPRAKVHVSFADTDSVVRLTGFLVRKGKTFQLNTADATTAEDMQKATAILVDSSVNSWTMRTTGPLRFHFAGNPGVDTIWIEDRKNPSQREWSRPSTMPSSSFSKDYGIVARFVNPETGRWELVAAGLGANGTSAATELLTDVRYMDEIAKGAPSEWIAMNIEAVISTEVVNGKHGAPKVIAVDVW